MDERTWNNEFLSRCAYPREIVVDGMRLRVTDAEHAAYWDEHGKSVLLADTDERHALELALLPRTEVAASFAELLGGNDMGEGEEGAGDAQEDESVDIGSMKQADALELVASTGDSALLGSWLLQTRNNQVKGAIKARLAELG